MDIAVFSRFSQTEDVVIQVQLLQVVDTECMTYFGLLLSLPTVPL